MRSRACLTLALVAGAAGLLPDPTRAETPPPKPEAVACLAEAVYHEARGTGDAGARAVAHVVLNRRAHGDFPGSVCGVVQDGCQFSYRCDGRPDGFRDPDERARALRIAKRALTGDSRDPTGGALFFHAESVAPGWFASRSRTAAIGGNVFYR